MNDLVKGFTDSLEKRYARNYSDQPMIEWIKTNTTLRGMPFSTVGYEFQDAIANDMHPNMSVIKCSQVGLALALDTPVPTTTGWTTMGEIRVGDKIFDEQGKPCVVEYISPIYLDRVCYQITFDDGEQIVADADHRWYVEVDRAFDLSGNYSGRGRPAPGSEMFKKGVLKTDLIAKNFKHGIRNRFAIPNTKPLECMSDDLPVEPYFLGLWLGDGNLHSPCLTATSTDAFFYIKELMRRGYVCKHSNIKDSTVQFIVNKPNAIRGLDSVSVNLKNMGLLGKKKFVPQNYLRGSYNTRLDVLRGLLDTDGSITKNGRVSFYNTNPQLIDDVNELARSLGFKTRTRWRDPCGGLLKSGHQINSRLPVAEVSFVAYSDNSVFLLPRKRERLGSIKDCRPSESLRRRIVDVKQVETTPVRCISVNSPSHLFLAGRGMIPTHNTEIQIRKILGFLVRNRGVSAIFSLPEEKLYRRVSQTRVKPIVDRDKVFNLAQDEGSVRSMAIMQFGASFLYLTGCTEGDATSTAADAVFNDEVDLSPQDMLALFNSRLQNSDWKLRQGFSTPTFIGYGIDSSFSISDQHLWLHKCSGCGHHNWPEFNRKFCVIPGLPNHIDDLFEIDTDAIEGLDLSKAYVACEKCGTPLTDEDERRWVPKYPSRLHSRGYWVTPFTTTRLTVGYMVNQLIDYKRRDFIRGFHNTVLGLPYSDSRTQIPLDSIAAAFNRGSDRLDELPTDVPLAIGIDMGATCHIVIGTADGSHILRFLAIPSFELEDFVRKLHKTHKLVCGGVDRMPYTPTAEALRDMTNLVVLPLQYGSGGVDFKLVEDEFKRLSYGSINRTRCLDEVSRAFRDNTLTLSGFGHQKQVITEHLRDMVRDEKPEQPAVWRKLTGNDHYFHAIGYYLASINMAPLIREHKNETDHSMFGFSKAEAKYQEPTLYSGRSRDDFKNERLFG